MAFGDKVENQMTVGIREEYANCSVCDGRGKTLMDDPREFVRWLNHKIYIEKLPYSERKRIKKEWRQSGGWVDCEFCRDSKGQVKVFV